MDKGSLRAATILLSVSALGPSLFSFHNVMNQVGIVVSVLISIATMHTYLFTIKVWNKAYELHPESRNLVELITKSAGKIPGSVHSFLMNLLMYISLIGVFICLSKVCYFLFGSSLLELFHVSKENITFETFNNFFIYFVALCFYGLFIKKDMSEFAAISFYSIFILFFIISVIIYQTPVYFRNLVNKKEADYRFYTFTLKDFLEAYGMILYCYAIFCSFF